MYLFTKTSNASAEPRRQRRIAIVSSWHSLNTLSGSEKQTLSIQTQVLHFVLAIIYIWKSEFLQTILYLSVIQKPAAGSQLRKAHTESIGIGPALRQSCCSTCHPRSSNHGPASLGKAESPYDGELPFRPDPLVQPLIRQDCKVLEANHGVLMHVIRRVRQQLSQLFSFIPD
jgi:hypothetical protein